MYLLIHLTELHSITTLHPIDQAIHPSVALSPHSISLDRSTSTSSAIHDYMHLFRSSTPYHVFGLLRCLSSPSTYSSCSSSSYTASQSRSHYSSFNSAANNPSESRKPTPSEKSGGNSEATVDRDDNSNTTSISIQPSHLPSISPDRAPKPSGRPIGRLDISDETTYMMPPAIGNNGRHSLKHQRDRGRNSSYSKRRSIPRNQFPRSSNYARPNAGEKNLPKKSGSKTKQSSLWARVALLNGVGSTLLESDIRRLIPGKTHIPEFKTEFDIICVSPYRLPKSLVRRPFYSLVFSSPQAAREFVRGQDDIWLSHETPNSTLPPGCKPRLYLPGEGGEKYYNNYRLLLSVQSRGGCSPGACVLLVVSGIGGSTPGTGKLPRTLEVRKMLEDSEVQFCEADEEADNAGFERIFFEKRLPDGTTIVDKFDGSGMGAEGKWIVRCRDAAEAHRVVRDWNGKELWGGVARFKAEILY